MLDRWQEHLNQRFGGTRAPRPLLPLLPLGVDQAALLEQRTDQDSRDFLRRYLRLAEHDVLVLWLGRLSFFEKALSPVGHVHCPSESHTTQWNGVFIL